MARNESAVELQQKLSLLTQAFFRELKRIAEQRQKIQSETISAIRSNILSQDDFGQWNAREAKPLSFPKTFTIRLESSIGEKLAKSRATADELEDKLRETRIALKDKVKTVDRMEKELDRREKVLVQSIREIEAYIRAVFYMKQEADEMLAHLKNTSREQDVLLRELENEFVAVASRKDSISKAISAFRPFKMFLEKMVSDLSTYSTIQEVIQYILVLETLQQELLEREAEYTREQEGVTRARQRLEEYGRRMSAIVVSKENTVLDLKSELENFKYETAQLEEQIDLAIVARIKEDAAWYDIQRWIKKLHLQSREAIFRPAELQDTTTVDRLDGLKDFVRDASQILDGLKDDRGKKKNQNKTV